MNVPRKAPRAKRIVHSVLVVTGAAILTMAFFLVLPLIQAISKPPTTDLLLRKADTAVLEAPPEVMEEPEEEPEPEEEEEPPELMEEAPPLDLSQLELALNPGFGDGWFGADFSIQLNTMAEGTDVDALFSMADLDEKPRCIYQPGPIPNPKTRKKAPGSVVVRVIVDENGRVDRLKVKSSTDPVFERPALAAVKRWKFEPGKINGKAVRSPVEIPITFPKD